MSQTNGNTTQVLKDRLETEYNIPTKLGKMKVSYRESINLAVQTEETFNRILNGRPLYFSIQMQIEPVDEDNDVDKNESSETAKKFFIGDNVLEFAFDMDDDFMRYYNEYKRRLLVKAKVKRKSDDDDDDDERALAQEEENQSELRGLKFVKNPAKPIEQVGTRCSSLSDKRIG